MAEVLGGQHLKTFCGSVIDEQRRLPRQISTMRAFRPPRSSSSSSSIYGLKLTVDRSSSRSRISKSSSPKMSLTIGKAQKWWEKGLQPNMKEVTSAKDLVDSLQNAGDKLVVVQFFSPGCGGCRALHPKICQLAEMNPSVEFVQVNYEEHKSMCYSLHVHVLPFFRFYRGSAGRLCSFSCTNATIKKFKDALAKHNTDRCSLGPPKGLEEKELLALAANRDLGFSYVPKPEEHAPEEHAPVLRETTLLHLSPPVQGMEKSLVATGS